MKTTTSFQRLVDSFAIYLLSFFILFHQTGCINNFQPVPVGKDALFSTNDFGQEYELFITSSNKHIRVINVEILSDRIEGEYRELTKKELRLLPRLNGEETVVATAVDWGSISRVMRVYTTQLDTLPPLSGQADGRFSIPISSIQSVKSFEFDEKILLANVANTISAVVVATIPVALFLIFLALKGSCPFLYTVTDENNFVLQGELFPGAIFQPLERADYFALQLPEDWQSNTLQFRLANQLKEIQYINKVSVWGVPTAPGSTATLSQRGLAYVYSQTARPNQLTNDDNQEIAVASHTPYTFKTKQRTPENLSSLSATFDLPENTTSALLVLDAKNHEWLEFMWYDLSRKIGTDYMDFVAMHRNSPPDYLNQFLEENGLKLRVQANENGTWRDIGAFEIAGPLAFRQLSMEIPQAYLNGNGLELRIQAGPGFWEVRDIALAINPSRAAKEKATLTHAIDHLGQSQSNLLTGIDESYLVQRERGNFVDLTFQFPKELTGKNTTVFFESAGYYEHQRNFTDRPDYTTARKRLTGTGFADASYELLHKVEATESELLVVQQPTPTTAN